jgi:hypothetical protein
MSTVQDVPAANAKFFAVSVRVRAGAPPVTSKEVVPQPVVVGVAKDPDENSGKNKTTVSLISMFAFITNAKDAVDALSLAAVPSPRVLKMSLVGSAVEVGIGVAEMSPGEVATVAANVRVFKLADCDTTLVVTPLPIVIVHAVDAAIVAPPT